MTPAMTIRDVRVTMLRMPWPDDPWLKVPLGPSRGFLIVDPRFRGKAATAEAPA